MDSDSKGKLLVTGGSGQLAGEVLDLLLDQGVTGLITTTRSPEKLSNYADRGVEVRQADFDQPDSLDGVFDGAERVLLISTSSVDYPGHRYTQHTNAIDAMKKAGVKHVCYTSIIDPRPDSPVKLTPDHYKTEEYLKQSGMGWTFLRNNLYMDMELMTWGRALKEGKLETAAQDGRAAYVTHLDCSRAAAAALASDVSENRALDITGPSAVSQKETAQLVEEITGKHIDVVDVPVEQIVKGFREAGLEEYPAEVFASFLTGIRKGVFENVTDTVKKLTGQAPTSIRSFLTANKDKLMG